MFARIPPAVPVAPVAPVSAPPAGQSTPSLPSLWSPPPPSLLRVAPESIALWRAHVAASLPWLRAHDAGVRALPSLAHPGRLPGVGVLVEPRPHPDTEFALRNFAHFCAPQGWGLVIAHGTANGAFMRALTAGWPHVEFIELPADDLPLPAYQQLMTSVAFWERFTRFRRVLLFQTDGEVMRGGTLGRDSPFLAPDFLGAPWANACAVCGQLIIPGGRACGHMIDHAALVSLAPNLVGNGGVSLRNPVAMRDACARYRLATTENNDDSREVLPGVTNEDTFAAVALTRMGRNVAPRAVAAEFAIEQVPPLSLDPRAPAATATHKPYAYLPPAVLAVVLAGVVYYGEDGTSFQPSPLSPLTLAPSVPSVPSPPSPSPH